VALFAAEVVVDHLHDAGIALAGYLGAGPQATDPLTVPDHRAERGHGTDQQPRHSEQDHIQTPAPARFHPCPAAQHLRRDGEQTP
jgi:hypothetical protein